MNEVRSKFIKSFSKGQVTIPKSIRQSLGIGDDFWLEMIVEDGNIIAKPVSQSIPSKAEYLRNISTMDTSWFDENDYKKMRKKVNERLREYE